VLDDVTPLIRAQRVAAWRDVARRLAHEIKNPLTPIQLSAERLRRNLSTAAPDAKALVDECTGAIIAEVDALKSLVDEFAQFARLRGPKMAPADLNAIIADVVRLYAGVLHSSRVVVEQRLAADAPLVRVDVEQIRQVIINLVDNALEALGGPDAPPRPDGAAPLIRSSCPAAIRCAPRRSRRAAPHRTGMAACAAGVRGRRARRRRSAHAWSP